MTNVDRASNLDRALAMVLAAALLLPCGACSQRWTFAPPQSPMSGAPTVQTPLRETGGAGAPSDRPQVSAAAYHAAEETSGLTADEGTDFGETLSTPQAPILQPLPAISQYSQYASNQSHHPACGPPGPSQRLQAMFHKRWHNVRADHANYYSWVNMRDLALGVAMASPVANTSWDADFQHWYQRDVRSSGSDDFTAFWKTFGEGEIFIPAFAGLGLLGTYFEHRPLLGVTGEFGDRVTRGFLVGAPPMLLMQYTLGASRPDEAGVGSQWKPFDDSNAVSGHAFMGAVPFITAAQMCDNRWAKSALYLCSTLTAWSRVNDDDHYLSQAWLGWWMAYLASRSVDQTQHEDRCVTFTPMIAPGTVGLGMVVQR